MLGVRDKCVYLEAIFAIVSACEGLPCGWETVATVPVAGETHLKLILSAPLRARHSVVSPREKSYIFDEPSSPSRSLSFREQFACCSLRASDFSSTSPAERDNTEFLSFEFVVHVESYQNRTPSPLRDPTILILPFSKTIFLTLGHRLSPQVVLSLTSRTCI